MKWAEIRSGYPNKWVLIEALSGNTIGNLRKLDDICIMEVFNDSRSALESYSVKHSQHPNKEMYVFHTSRENIEVEERNWLGIRL